MSSDTTKTCQACGEHFSRGYNLRRHRNGSCPLLSQPEEQIMDEYPEYTHDDKEEIEEEDVDQSDVSQSDEEMSEDSDDASDTESEEEDSVWTPIKEQAKARHRQGYEELVQGFLNDGMGEKEAKELGFRRILPVLQKEARKVYLEKLKWMRELRKDPMHKKVMETKQSFTNIDNFDGDEAIEAAVQKRKFLLNKMFDEDDGYDDSDTDED